MDHRIRVAVEGKWYTSFDKKTMMAAVAYTDEDDCECLAMVPCKYEVCGTCRGKGTHVNPNVDSGGLSQEDFDSDPDFRKSYFSGMYDVDCNECGGLRVVPEPDEARLSKDAKKALAYAEICRQERLDDYETCRRENGEY